MNIILLSHDNFNFQLDKYNVVTQINTKDLSIGSILNSIKDNTAEIIVIPAEQEIESNIYGGIELVKHIRLTIDLGDIAKKPIVLLHWLPIDYYIQKDKENIFLYSPGISSCRLPAKEINFSALKGLEENLTPFLFNSEKDQTISSHVFRNQIAIEQFKQQVNNPGEGLQGKDLWFKKLFYKNHSNIKPGELKKIEIVIEPIKILFADDMAADWESALKTIMPKAELNAFDNKDEIFKQFETINQNKQKIIQTFNTKTRELRKLQQDDFNFREIQTTTKNELKTKEILLSNNEKKLETIQAEDKGLKTKFSNLIELLSSDGGLLDVLISQTDTDEINERSREDAQGLTNIIKDILTKRTELKTNKSAVDKILTEIEKLRNHLTTLDDNIKQINTEKKTKQVELDQSIDALFKPTFDLVLLDMHFTTTTENIKIEDTDGFAILQKINELNIHLPVVIFSASTKDFQAVMKKFPFVIDRFIKGISPAVEFIKIAQTACQNREINNLTELINQLSNFDTYSGRRYYLNDGADFSIYTIDNSKKIDIKLKLNSILGKFKQYKQESNIQQLIEVIQLLGIIQESRLSLPPQSRDNSFWYIPNTEKNKIGDDELFLKQNRNTSSHAGQTEEWKDNINLNLIRSLLITTYKRLLLG